MGGNFHEFRRSVAERESIIRKYCVAYKVWLKYENTIREILFPK